MSPYLVCFVCLLFLALVQNRTLLTLELGTNSLTDHAAQLMGDMLKINMTLEGLSLWQNEISPEGAQCLAEGLKVSPLHGQQLKNLIPCLSII